VNNFKDKSIILFDGVCNLCNSAVNFIIKHDQKEHFLFASLQSDVAKEILLQFHSEKTDLSSIILLKIILFTINQKLHCLFPNN